MKLWGILRKKQRIVDSLVAEVPPGPAIDEDWLHGAIGEICSKLDIARPLVLKKHAVDFETFSRVVFKQGDFMEKISFDQFEVERIDQEKKRADPNAEFYD